RPRASTTLESVLVREVSAATLGGETSQRGCAPWRRQARSARNARVRTTPLGGTHCGVYFRLASTTVRGPLVATRIWPRRHVTYPLRSDRDRLRTRRRKRRGPSGVFRQTRRVDRTRTRVGGSRREHRDAAVEDAPRNGALSLRL